MGRTKTVDETAARIGEIYTQIFSLEVYTYKRQMARQGYSV